MMRILKAATTVLAGLAISPSAIFAQWPEYPTPGPRTKDGKIDLAAAPPRTADGKPDFSGLWEPARGQGGRGGTSMNGTLPLPFAIPSSPEDPPVAQFFNIGAGFKEGLPFTGWAAQVRAQRKGDNNKDNPDAACLPLGLTQLHMHPQPRKVVQTQREVVILYEANGNVRQILTDGRPLPDNSPTPWWYGYSAGRWDGDTLVVETTGFRDDVWLDVEGSPLTSFRENDRALAACEVRADADRYHDRRSEGLHEAVHSAGESSTHAGHGAYGVRLRGERRRPLCGQGRQAIEPG
jgi:hypothetical protein